MITKSDVGQLLSDQVSEFLGRKQPLIEAEPYDDEDGEGYKTLDRWGDARFSPYRSRWSELDHPMTDWKV